MFSSQKISYKLSAGEFTGLQYLYPYIICSNATQKGRKGGKKITSCKARLKFFLSPSTLYFLDITILTELRTKIFHNFTCLQRMLKTIAGKRRRRKNTVDSEQEACA